MRCIEMPADKKGIKHPLGLTLTWDVLKWLWVLEVNTLK